MTRNEFVTKALQLCGMKTPGLSRRNKRKAIEFQKFSKPGRSLNYDATIVPWARYEAQNGVRHVEAEILSDSELVMN